MYKEVEINSQQDLALYLINKGDLYAGETKVQLTFCSTKGSWNPFKIQFSGGDVGVFDGYWNTRDTTYYKKVEWFESIPEGKRVPCYVSDASPEDKHSREFVTSYDKHSTHPYKASITGWKYATPIPANELWVPES